MVNVAVGEDESVKAFLAPTTNGLHHLRPNGFCIFASVQNGTRHCQQVCHALLPMHRSNADYSAIDSNSTGDANGVINRFGWPLGTYLLSRVALFLLVWFNLVSSPLELTEGQWQAFPQTLWLDGWVRWDSGWYAPIAMDGYIDPADLEPDKPRNTAFFPAYPLTVKTLSYLTGNVFIAGLIVSNLFAALVVLLFYDLACLKLGVQAAQRAHLLFILFPFSFYLNAMYTEAMFLAFVLGAFCAAERKLWVYAGILAGVASAVRPHGILAPLGLGLIYAQQINFNWRLIRPDLGWLTLGAAGLGAYMLFLADRYGNPFEFVAVQSNWPVDLSLFPLNREPKIYFLLCCAAVVMLCIRRFGIGYGYVAWALAMTALSYIKLPSFGRFALVIFPVFFVWGALLRTRWLLAVVLSYFTVMLALNAIDFARWQWVA
jgi:hypothetical protein